ncbi:MAG TPA: DinB family protein [Bryobacteraceae bacterium]|jgi:uncharacterized damage-inducible protein DinB|nr:DinB family protein [Bryobacteraceae bacterium]
MDVSAPDRTSTLTQAEKDKARRYLAETSEGLAQAIESLSDAQWTYKPEPDCWSIGEIAEHVVIVERRVLQRFATQFPEAPAPPADRDVQQLDESVMRSGVDRSSKFLAPAAIAPTGQLTMQEVLERFAASRAGIDAFLDAPADHRRHAMPHPVIGLLDAYQWVLLVSAHAARHTKQIQEVKAVSGFPAE